MKLKLNTKVHYSSVLSLNDLTILVGEQFGKSVTLKTIENMAANHINGKWRLTMDGKAYQRTAPGTWIMEDENGNPIVEEKHDYTAYIKGDKN